MKATEIERGQEQATFSFRSRSSAKVVAREPMSVLRDADFTLPMAAFGVGTVDARDALKVVATGAEPLPDLLDTLKAITAVGGGVLLIVLGAEVA